MSSSSAQILRQAEALKATIADSGTGTNEAWVSRQKLQDLYQKLLVVDLEFALDKKVEQDLWNHAFKNQINLLQGQSKDRQNPKRNEIQASLQLFLQTASGFYLQLLQEICSVFNLDLPFRRKSSYLGILKESKLKIKTPEKGSCLYICQHCLVHLGDIARYRQQIEQAQTYYRHAAVLVPFNGQPYNQLAILETAKGNKLSTVFFYIRSIAVKHPFPVASTNLEKLYAKLGKETLEYRGKLSMSEIIMAFLQFHALVHLHRDFERARKLSEKLLSSLPTHITSMSFSSYQLIQMVSINLYSMYYQKRQMEGLSTAKIKNKELSKNPDPQHRMEEKAYSLVFTNTVSFLDSLLHHTPKQEHKAKEYHTLPAIKVIMDWIRLDKDLLCKPTFKNCTIWPSMSKLLNNLQFHSNSKDSPFNPEKYAKTPLPEEVDLQCFLAIHKCYSHLDFDKLALEGMTPEIETRLRCHQLVRSGIWISEQFPSLNLINVQKLATGRIQFSAPTAQVKVLPGGESEASQEKKSCRQNVAIQAIMQNRAGKKNAGGSQNTAPVQEKEVTLLTSHQHKKQKPEEVNPADSEEWPYPGSNKPVTRPNFINPPVIHNPSHGKPSPVQSPTANNSNFPHQQQTYMHHSPTPRQMSPHLAQPSQHSHINGPTKMEQATPPKSFPPPAGIDSSRQHLSPSGYPSMQQQQAQFVQQQQQQQGGQPKLNAHYQGAPQQTHLQGKHPNADVHFNKGMHVPPQNQGPNLHGAGSFHIQQQGGQVEGHYHNATYGALNKQNHTPHNVAGRTPSTAMHNMQGGAPQLHNSPCPSPLSAMPMQGGMFHQPPPPPPAARQMAHPGSGMRHVGPSNLNIPNNTAEAFQQPAQSSAAVLDTLHLQQLKNLESQQSQHMRGMQHPLAGLHQPLPQQQQQPQQHPQQLAHGFLAQQQQPQPVHVPQQTPPAGVRVRQMGVVTSKLGEAHHPAVAYAAPGNHMRYQSDNHDIKISDFGINVRLPPPTAALNSNFQLSSLNFAGNADEHVPKPDSPPPQAQSLFSQHGNDKNSLYCNAEPVTGTYTLFSHSPWSMNINAAGNGKPGSDASSFGSQSSSLRGTPDPFGDTPDNMLQPGNYGGALGYAFGKSDERNWTSRLSPQRVEASTESSNTLLSSNIQSLWSSGPSPLERLLEQQKIQRQNDPH